MLENIIMVLVIGIMILVCGFALIQKVFEERRKDNKDVVKIVTQIFEETTKMFTGIMDTVSQKEKEQKEAFNRELEIVHERDD